MEFLPANTGQIQVLIAQHIDFLDSWNFIFFNNSEKIFTSGAEGAERHVSGERPNS